jgi:hypothetical protein
MLTWFREHPPIAIGVLAGLTSLVMGVLWQLIAGFIPQVVQHQDFIGRGLLVC